MFLISNWLKEETTTVANEICEKLARKPKTGGKAQPPTKRKIFITRSHSGF
jgi:hypothetical protein